MKKILNLENVAYFLIIILPLYLIRVKFLGLPTNLWEILAVISLFLWIMSRKNRLRIDATVNFYSYLLVGLSLSIAGLIISTIINKNYLTGIGIIKSWFLVPFLFSFMVINLSGQDRLKNILRSLFVSASGVALISLIYYIVGWITYDGRLEAFFNSPNYLAMYLSPAVVIAIYLLEKRQVQKAGNLIIYVPLAFILLALFLTRSYAAWFSIVVSLIILALMMGKLSKKHLAVAAIIFLLGVSLQKRSDKLSDLLTLDERSSLA